MGVVYEALQDEPRRTVAVKVMKDSIGGDEALQRFRYEAQLLARLRHPGIAQVYEAGTHDVGTGSLPYFAMEYIPNAKPITEYASAKKLTSRERLELFANACDAVHHGHQRGVVHRDLKPSNILVDSHGQPRVIDFGVARATDSDMATVQTQVGQLIGSLQYMSPEQFDADPNDIDTRSDVYALGVIFYELMSGGLPYDVSSTTIVEAANMVREYRPPKLGQSHASLRGDVETIALKALEKDRDHRYQSAFGLASDIRRYLDGQAISARPPSVTYQMRVFARRNKALIGSSAVVVVALLAATVVSTTAWVKAERERERAEAQTERTLAAVEFLKGMVSSAVPSEYGENITLRNVLDKASDGCSIAFRDDPATEAEIREAVGWGYLPVFEMQKSVAQFKESLELRRSAFGNNHAATIKSLAALSRMYSILGRLDDQQGVLEEIIEAETALYGFDHQETLGTRSDLALVLAENGHVDEARDMANDVLDVRRREMGEDARWTVEARIILALISLWDGEYDEAEKASRETYETCVRVFGEDDQTTREARSQLGAILVARGRMEESHELYGRVDTPENMGIIEPFQGEGVLPAEGNYVYVFWEAWCPFSQRSVPWLEDIHRRFKDQNLNIVGLTTVSRSSTDDDVRHFIRDNGITFPILKESGSARKYFNMSGTPFITFVRDGKLVWEHKLPTERFPDLLFEALIQASN
jgi:tetratricopeptide (TPR) repeat protein